MYARTPSKRKILLVEDEPTIQRLLHFMLTKEFDLRVANNGYEAFMMLEDRFIPDLIILDWVMPHMDGRAFLKCIKVSGIYREIPIIVLSASSNVLEEVDGLHHRVYQCVSKPFDPQLLRTTIETVMNTNAYGFAN